MKNFSPLTLLIILFSLLNHPSIAQENSLNDTLPLPEVIIHAYDQNQSLLHTPASVSLISSKNLKAALLASPIALVNALPGVRMEERSPGSYRLNIRGSSLRSPFGVRNVKFYYNGIPFSDPGGTTYLNQLSLYQLDALEILKGPGSSIYGAGTGGVVLLHSYPVHYSNEIQAAAAAGSYGYYTLCGKLYTAKLNHVHQLQVQHEQSDGFREHSAMRRDLVSWDQHYTYPNKNRITVHLVAGDLWYETPGALTLAEYQANPKAARPRIGSVPGSAESKAAIFQQMLMAGVTYLHHYNSQWQQQLFLYGTWFHLKNPNIRNYENTKAPHTGVRTLLQYEKKLTHSLVNWQTGIEIQQGFSRVQSFRNASGDPAELISDNRINTRQAFIFSQANLQSGKWTLSAGISLNHYQTSLHPLNQATGEKTTLHFPLHPAPRLSMLYAIHPQLTVFTSYTHGFSPPTTSELFPDNQPTDAEPEAEKGNNLEAGLKGSFLQHRLYFDITGFYFSLHNTIVQRRDAAGGNYFINAGSTRQKGMEATLQYTTYRSSKGFLRSIQLTAAYSLHRFRYKDFIQLTNDYGGKQLPGVPPHTLATSAVINFGGNFSWMAEAYYNSSMYLNDANAMKAPSYVLFNNRLTYRFPLSASVQADLFFTIQNLGNITYSAGNDINGFGGRYYNAAAGRNYQGGCRFSFARK